jgi:hypothetical protein
VIFRIRHARIGLRTAAVLSEEPIQVRRAILCIAAKIVVSESGEISEHQRAIFSALAAAVPTPRGQRIERIKRRAGRRSDTRSIRRSAPLRRRPKITCNRILKIPRPIRTWPAITDYRKMSNAVYPTVRGLTWTVLKTLRTKLVLLSTINARRTFSACISGTGIKGPRSGS